MFTYQTVSFWARTIHTVLIVAALWCVAGSLVGCQTGSHRRSSSVMDYLYPIEKDGKAAVQEAKAASTPPVLHLPLRVGVAFVPGSCSDYDGPSALQKAELLREVAKHFEKREYIKSIEVISSSYLVAGGSFANVDQLATMYNLDIIALVSYDQTQSTSEGVGTISYLTIVGAYIIPAEKNTTHTMLDTTVFDIPSRRLLFRAPGTSKIKGLATFVGLDDQLSKDSLKGFTKAGVEMQKNLDIELDAFRERVKNAPETATIVNRPGYTGAGSVDGVLVGIALCMGGASWLRKRAQKNIA